MNCRILLLIGVSLVLPSVLGANRVWADAMTSELSAYASTDGTGAKIGDATAAHGFIDGTDVDGDGEPLLTYLNAGTSLVVGTENMPGPAELPLLEPNATKIEISKTGMFSTTKNRGTADDGGENRFSDTDIVDLTDGSAVSNTSDWVFLSKYDIDTDVHTGETVFDVIYDQGTEKAGTIKLASDYRPLSGNFVISLKAGNQYSVYAFEQFSGVSSLRFDLTESVGAGGLSHLSIFTGDPSDGPLIPEPSSLALVAIGLLGFAGVRRRTR